MKVKWVTGDGWRCAHAVLVPVRIGSYSFCGIMPYDGWIEMGVENYYCHTCERLVDLHEHTDERGEV